MMPPAAQQALRALGENLALARVRRREPQRAWAKRLGVSVPTLIRLERGDPGVGAGIYATALWGGARPKALVNIGGEQWVMKFAAGDPADTPLIEHAAMTLAACGVTAADIDLYAQQIDRPFLKEQREVTR